MTAMVSKNILVFLHLTKEGLKSKEELPWLSRTSTLETIPYLDVKLIGGSFVGRIESTVQLIVAGMYYRYTCKH